MLLTSRKFRPLLLSLVAIVFSGCASGAAQEKRTEYGIGTRKESQLTDNCSGPEREEYVLARLDRFGTHWDKLGGRSDVRCEITLSLSRDGDVLATEFQECPNDADLRGRMLSAIESAEPFPESPNPACFSDTFHISVGPPKNSH